MIIFIKAKSDDQTNIDKYREAANITEFHCITISIFLRIIIPKFIMISQLFYINIIRQYCKNSTCLKWTHELFGYNYRVDKHFTLFSLTVSGIIKTSMKSITISNMPKSMNFKKSQKIFVYNGHTDFLVLIIELLCF